MRASGGTGSRHLAHICLAHVSACSGELHETNDNPRDCGLTDTRAGITSHLTRRRRKARESTALPPKYACVGRIRRRTRVTGKGPGLIVAGRGDQDRDVGKESLFDRMNSQRRGSKPIALSIASGAWLNVNECQRQDELKSTPPRMKIDVL
jgi:hypothetical protein